MHFKTTKTFKKYLHRHRQQCFKLFKLNRGRVNFFSFSLISFLKCFFLIVLSSLSKIPKTFHNSPRSSSVLCRLCVETFSSLHHISTPFKQPSRGALSPPGKVAVVASPFSAVDDSKLDQLVLLSLTLRHEAKLSDPLA